MCNYSRYNRKQVLFLNFMKFLHFLGSTRSTNISRAPVRVSPYFDSSHFSAAAHLLIISEL